MDLVEIAKKDDEKKKRQGPGKVAAAGAVLAGAALGRYAGRGAVLAAKGKSGRAALKSSRNNYYDDLLDSVTRNARAMGPNGSASQFDDALSALKGQGRKAQAFENARRPVITGGRVGGVAGGVAGYSGVQRSRRKARE